MQNKEQDPPGNMGDAVIIRNTALGLKVVTDTHQQQQPKPEETGQPLTYRNIITSTSLQQLGDFSEI